MEAPKWFKILGPIDIALGTLLALVNVFLVENAISVLERAGADGGGALRVEEVFFVIVGALLVVGGVGLSRGRRWGRVVTLVAAVGCVLGMLVVGGISGAVTALAEARHVSIPSVTTGGALSPVFGIALLVVLNLREARDFGAGRAPVAPGTPGAPVVPQQTSVMAIMSMVLSIIPFMLVTPLVGLILAIVALGQIKRSNGALGGRGFAIAGIVLASFWYGLGLLIVLLVVFSSHK